MKPEIYNGQCWGQKDFPCFTIMVLMLDHVNGELMFCKVGIGGPFDTPLVMNEEDGTWMYNEENLLKQLKDRKYEVIGRGCVVIREEHDQQTQTSR